jgi:hypothetical protein
MESKLKEIKRTTCTNCSVEHNNPSSFCSQFCFDEWLTKVMVKSITEANKFITIDSETEVARLIREN